MSDGTSGVPLSSPYCPDNTLPLLETVSEDQEIHAKRKNGWYLLLIIMILIIIITIVITTSIIIVVIIIINTLSLYTFNGHTSYTYTLDSRFRLLPEMFN